MVRSKIVATGNLMLVIEISVGFSFLYNISDRGNVTKLTDATMLKVDSGFCTPIKGSNVFNKRPRNIKKARLNPAERSRFFKKPKLSILKNFKSKKPGTKERKTKLNVCLIINMLKTTAASVNT